MDGGRKREEFWGEIYGRLMAHCHYLPSQIDILTMRDVERLYKHWRHYPTVDVILAAVYKITPKLTPEEAEENERREIARIKGLFKKDPVLVNLQEFSAKHKAVRK